MNQSEALAQIIELMEDGDTPMQAIAGVIDELTCMYEMDAGERAHATESLILALGAEGIA